MSEPRQELSAYRTRGRDHCHLPDRLAERSCVACRRMTLRLCAGTKKLPSRGTATHAITFDDKMLSNAVV